MLKIWKIKAYKIKKRRQKIDQIYPNIENK